MAVAVDFSPCSRKALKWAVDNVVKEGDHLILVTVRPEGNYEEGEAQLWAVTGSRTFSLLLFSNHTSCRRTKGRMYTDLLNCRIRNHLRLPIMIFFIYFGVAAFIPLTEFSDETVMKKYGVKTDAETLDIVSTISRQKGVRFFYHFFLFFQFY